MVICLQTRITVTKAGSQNMISAGFPFLSLSLEL